MGGGFENQYFCKKLTSMKKVITLVVLTFMFSCSKDDLGETVAESPILPTAFTILSDPNKTMNNLVVGNRIEYAIKIENFDTNPDVLYVLKPIVGNASKHQLNRTDFNFQTLEPNDVYKSRDSIIIKNSNTKMYLQILRPGTFQHEYTLQKMISNKKINAVAKQPILFSAVKINIWSPTVEVVEGNFWHSSEHLRYYYFNIDDGEEQFDNYLTNSDSKSHVYLSNYEGGEISGGFTAHNTFIFKNSVHEFSAPVPIYTYVINEIKITQNITASPVNIIRYNNISF